MVIWKISWKPVAYYYLKDHLGNIRVTVDENGNTVTADDYYPFGLQMPGRSYNIAATNDLYKLQPLKSSTTKTGIIGTGSVCLK